VKLASAESRHTRASAETEGKRLIGSNHGALAASIGALLMLHAPASGARETADTILFGGTIHTLRDDSPSTVEALAIGRGAVLAAGTHAEIEALCDDSTERIDLRGATAVPGLVDAHAHLFNLAQILATADLRGTASAEECVSIALAKAEELPPDAWVMGRGWDQNDWADTAYPDRSLLDAAFGDRPVCLRRVDGHASWLNGAALRLAGFDRDTPDPEGGEIVRDPATGEPSGVVIDSADDLLRSKIPEASKEELERRLKHALDAVAAAGLTGVHEMGVTRAQLRLLQRAETEGWLPIRVVAYLGGVTELDLYEGQPVRPGPAALLRVDGVKLYADGALGSRGAALFEDYTDRPGHRGLLQSSEEELALAAARAFSRDFTVVIHAIGDRGNHVALNAIERGYRLARRERAGLRPLGELRPRVEHVQVLHPDDVPRFRALGAIPSMQPTHCTSDMPWAPERLGPERIRGAYAWRTLRDAGNILPLGSDFPVEEVSPLFGLHAALARRTPEGHPPGGWSPEERLTPIEALLGFTAWPAEAIGVREWGRLAPGFRADVTVLDRDPIGAANGILEARVLLTMVEGKIRYRDESF
jgi:predicted amidohydrolase YtcJ